MNDAPIAPQSTNPKTPRKRSRVLAIICAALCVALGALGGIFLLRVSSPEIFQRVGMRVLASRLSRPDGMHPVAFGAFVRACGNARVQPFRFGQTLGNHPRSKGYHRRDGVFRENGVRREYSAAVDIGVWDLTPLQTSRLCSALAQQGFAPFLRRGTKWKGNEHIHAVYAFLPMKPQLRRQVRGFLQSRRAAGLPRLRWEKKLRRRGYARG